MKALFPLDGSAKSLAALERGLELLGDAEATLLVVQHTGFEDAPEDRVQEFDDDEDDEVFPTADSAERLLERARRHCQELGHEVETARVTGRVIPAIVDASAGYDVLVMSGLDRSGVREKIHLGKKEKIARRAQCSVLLVDGCE